MTWEEKFLAAIELWRNNSGIDEELPSFVWDVFVWDVFGIKAATDLVDEEID